MRFKFSNNFLEVRNVHRKYNVIKEQINEVLTVMLNRMLSNKSLICTNPSSPRN